MPEAAPRPCMRPACPEMASVGGYCVTHARPSGRLYDRGRRQQVATLATAARIRSTSRWRVVRVHERRKWPLCCDPFASGCRQPTAQINHIEGLASRPDLAYVESNHAPVCTACHAKVSAIERRGDDTASLFAGWQSRYVASPDFGKKTTVLPLSQFTCVNVKREGVFTSLAPSAPTPTG